MEQQTKSQPPMATTNDTKPTSWADQAEEEAANLSEGMKKLTTDEPAGPNGEKEEILHDEEAKITVRSSAPLSSLYAAVSKFEDLNLKPELLKGVFGMGFNRPSKIQEVSLPLILGNPPSNLIAQAQSGTGKTAAFTLGMLSRIDASLKVPQALCVSPTRELARQIFDVATTMGKFTTIVPCLIVPEEKLPKRIESQLIIGTPGKIQDLITRRQLDVRGIKIFVLDEADVMLDKQGMKAQSLRLKGALPGRGQGCQMLLFSATYNEEVEQFADEFVPEPRAAIRLERKELSLDKIAQFYIECHNEGQRFNILCDLYVYLATYGQSIIFLERRDTATNLAKRMVEEGHTVSLLHGDLKANERDKIIDDFRAGVTKVLITTNVLARGIDIQQVMLVINYDLPLEAHSRIPDYPTYLHRIGRSGRFGRSGIAINFVHDETSKKNLRQIEAYFGREIKPFPEDVSKLEGMLKEIM